MKVWVVTLTVALLASTVRMSWAIGLGDMTTQSFVNAPLSATIEVLQPNGLTEAAELLQSVISMGDAAQCEQARALLDSLD